LAAFTPRCGERRSWCRHARALVVSHWVLDFITHRPDLPLTPTGSTRVGLGLWNSIPATLAVEATIFAIGLALYLRATRARRRAGTIGLWSLVAFLLLIYAASTFGPPPRPPPPSRGRRRRCGCSSPGRTGWTGTNGARLRDSGFGIWDFGIRD